MSKIAEKVIEAWKQGKRASTPNTWTDGTTVFLYGTPIICRRSSDGDGAHGRLRVADDP